MFRCHSRTVIPSAVIMREHDTQSRDLAVSISSPLLPPCHPERSDRAGARRAVERPCVSCERTRTVSHHKISTLRTSSASGRAAPLEMTRMWQSHGSWIDVSQPLQLCHPERITCGARYEVEGPCVWFWSPRHHTRTVIPSAVEGPCGLNLLATTSALSSRAKWSCGSTTRSRGTLCLVSISSPPSQTVIPSEAWFERSESRA